MASERLIARCLVDVTVRALSFFRKGGGRKRDWLEGLWDTRAIYCGWLEDGEEDWYAQ